MNIRIVKIDLLETNEQLKRIADLLERVVGATDPIPAGPEDFPGDDTQRVIYSNNDEEIVQYQVERLGKRYKPRTPSQ